MHHDEQRWRLCLCFRGRHLNCSDISLTGTSYYQLFPWADLLFDAPPSPTPLLFVVMSPPPSYLCAGFRCRVLCHVPNLDGCVKNKNINRVLFPADPEADLAAIIDSIPSLSRFSSLLKEHGLSPTASGSGGSGGGGGGDKKFTVFSPTNDALARLEERRPWLFDNSTSFGGGVRGAGTGAGGWSPLRELLAYHVMPGDAQFSRCVIGREMCPGAGLFCFVFFLCVIPVHVDVLTVESFSPSL